MKLKIKKTLSQSITENFRLMLGYALSLVAALAWNDAIQSLIRAVFPKESASSITIKFIYAIIITLLAVMFIFFINRLEKSVSKLKKLRKN